MKLFYAGGEAEWGARPEDKRNQCENANILISFHRLQTTSPNTEVHQYLLFLIKHRDRGK